jgi:hypothetical protein
MEISKELIEKVRNTDEETLKLTIKSIAAAMGATEKQTQQIVGNISNIKAKLATMSEADIQKYLNKQVKKIGDDKAVEIAKQLHL